MEIATNSDMETVPAKLTKRIVTEMEELIKQGWYANKSELIRSAVRELVKKQKVTELESAIKEDIQWGLYGK
ncbi:MAG: ribbon-helix-helix domain-containing protein [Nanoarchaeota archaeon]